MTRLEDMDAELKQRGLYDESTRELRDSLTTLEADDARRVYVSVRDGRSFFDQLRLPKNLSYAMCRPGVTLAELLEFSEEYS